MKIRYRFFSVVLSSALLTTAFGMIPCNAEAAASYEPVIKINGEALEQKEYFEKDGCVYISSQACRNSFGMQVVCGEKFVEMADENMAALFTADIKECIYDNKKINLAQPAVLHDGTVYLPLDDLCKIFGKKMVENDEGVDITYQPSEKDIGNGKKVYALYHTLRGTRENDGMNLNWDAFYETPASKTGRSYSLYNADLVDENGNHNVASINGGPLTNIGSDLDKDYLEYEVLLGKTGGIDGFALDFAFIEHTGTQMQEIMLEQAEKYGFEVSVDYTDSSAVNTTWIENYRDDIIGRDARVAYVKKGMQYLLDTIYSSKSAANIDGHPLIFFFGGGLQKQEYIDLLNFDFKLPDSTKKMYIVRRYPFSGSYVNGDVQFKDSSEWDQWVNIGIDAHTWSPDRVRPMDKDNLDFDTYASFDDMKKYQAQAVNYWKTGKKANINVACATPGFDNRGCGAWGAGSFRGYDRYDGELYQWEWNYFNENKNLIDVVFIGSWNDFTEGHEIQPSVNNGYREIETTQEYSSKLKDKEYNEDKKAILRVPQKIYELRKKTEKYQQIGFDTSECKNEVDAAALAISREEKLIADTLIENADKRFDNFDKDIDIEKIHLSQKDNSIVITEGEELHTDTSKGAVIDSFKSITANDEKNGAASKAIDKMLNDESCWRTASDKDEYNLDMEYEYSYDFTGVDLYSGYDNGNNVMQCGELQYYDNDEWKTIPGTLLEQNNEQYRYIKFSAPIKTSKLRLLCRDGERGCVIREIIPYATYASKLKADKEIFENTPIKYKKGDNVALGSTVTANGSNSGYPARNLVDGITTDESRWIYTSSKDNYFAELEFDKKYSIIAADIYTGKADGSWALSDFYLEYDKNGVWEKIPGADISKNPTSNVNISFSFAPITTSKVRLVCADGANGCRIREIAIYENGGIDKPADTGIEIRGEEISAKALVTSDDEIKGYSVNNINDRNITDNSMWVTGTDKDRYIVEYTFDKKYDIVGNDIYSGYTNGTWAFGNVSVQYFDGSEWLDIRGGSIKDNPADDTLKKWNFDEVVNTDKIRYVFTDGTRGIRIRDIMIYTKSFGENDGLVNLKNNAYASVNENVREKLNNNYFEGTISYDLLSLEKGKMTIKGCSDRKSKKVGVNYGNFSVIGQLQNAKTLGWEHQTMELYKKSLCFDGRYKNNSDFIMYGINPIKNTELDFTVYKKIR